MSNYWTKNKIIEALDLSAMAESVELPVSQYRELLECASLATPAVLDAYAAYPDLELNQLDPLQMAQYLEMSVLMKTTYVYDSFVHKVFLQAAHIIRQLSAAPKQDESVE